MKNKDIITLALLAFAGLVTWVGISMHSSLIEAWDSPLFFVLGIPLMILISFIAGLINPDKFWLYGIAVVSLQPIALFIMSPRMGPLIVVGMMFFLFYGVLCTIGALAGWGINKIVTKVRTK